MTTDALFPPLATIPAADAIRDDLTSGDEPCWIVVHPDGRPAIELFFEENLLHFDTADEATKFITNARYADDPEPDVRPHQLAEPCWTAVAACGYRFDEEDEGVTHFESRSQAAETVLRCDWRVRDGVLRCGDDLCEACS